MSTLATTHSTLLDVARLLDTSGNILPVAEILSATNDIMDDMPWIASNEATGHTSVVRAGLPSVTWRKLYGGVQPSKSTTAKVREGLGMLEGYSEIDLKLAQLSGNAAAFRAQEEKSFIESFGQTFASTLWYGDTSVYPERFNGFAPRYNNQSAENGVNIITSAATPDSTDNTSIYLVGWGENVTGLYPKGTMAGLQQKDLGEVTIENVDGNGGRMQALRTHFTWDCGLHVKDWRYVVRINIDAEDLVKNAATGPDLIDLMSQAIDLIPNLSSCRPVFYANRTVRGFIRRQIMNKTVNSTLSIEQITRANGASIRVPTFDGIPIRRSDALLNTESGI
jgi:hypothetical protein